MIQDLGKYQVHEEIGRGAMGVVYLGHDPFLDTPVALKVSHRERDPEGPSDEFYRTLFFNEMRAAGMLRHPNIVRVYDAGVGAKGDYYIAMEYVPGGRTLEVHCRAGNLLPLPRAAEIVFQCAEALDYSHRKGVIHRDIKPSNILLGDADEVKVADFSIALLTDPRIADTQLMVPVGSPLYMAPEQMREEVATNQSDLFALGVVFYELLTGRHPFAANTLAGVTHRVLNETPPALETLRPGLPESLRAIMERALAKPLDARYRTAFDLAADLSQIFTELEHPRDGIATEGRADRLKQLRFFESFADAEVWELLRWARWEEYAPGERLIVEGEEGDSLFIIVGGEVEVLKGERTVAKLPRGECVGEIGYLNNQRRTATVRAVTEVSALSINSKVLHRASQDCQLQFQKVFIETLVTRLVQTTSALAKGS